MNFSSARQIRTPFGPRGVLPRAGSWSRSRLASGIPTNGDPFAVNPIRRSFAVVAVSASLFVGPLLIGGAVAELVLLAVGWLAATGLVFGVPILLWSLADEGWRAIRRRRFPTVDQLDLSPRVRHVLLRHGYDAIDAVDRASDATLLLLSNMDQRGLREVRRAVSLWQYRRWQEGGFR